MGMVKHVFKRFDKLNDFKDFSKRCDQDPYRK